MIAERQCNGEDSDVKGTNSKKWEKNSMLTSTQKSHWVNIALSFLTTANCMAFSREHRIIEGLNRITLMHQIL
jgi:hypothetical protein